MQSNDLSYSKRLKNIELGRIDSAERENQAIVHSLDVLARREQQRNAESNQTNNPQLQNQNNFAHPNPPANTPSLGKRPTPDFANPQPPPQPQDQPVPRPPATNSNSQTIAKEAQDAKIELIFKHMIHKRKKQEEIQNELYKSDTFALNSKNYKKEYYFKKFGVKGPEYDSFRDSMKLYYIEGIVWNFTYYYKGCVAWNWFFPYYYAPLLSDLTDFHAEVFEFEMGRPFRPFEQLLSVLPPISSFALPKALQPLALSDESPIVDFYPQNFHIGELMLFFSLRKNIWFYLLWILDKLGRG